MTNGKTVFHREKHRSQRQAKFTWLSFNVSAFNVYGLHRSVHYATLCLCTLKNERRRGCVEIIRVAYIEETWRTIRNGELRFLIRRAGLPMLVKSRLNIVPLFVFPLFLSYGRLLCFSIFVERWYGRKRKEKKKEEVRYRFFPNFPYFLVGYIFSFYSRKLPLKFALPRCNVAWLFIRETENMWHAGVHSPSLRHNFQHILLQFSNTTIVHSRRDFYRKTRTLVLVLEKTFRGNCFFLARTFLRILSIFISLSRYRTICIGGDENQIYRAVYVHMNFTVTRHRNDIFRTKSDYGLVLGLR